MTMLRENLLQALEAAIALQERRERDYGYLGESSLLRGWKDVRDALLRGEHIEISDD